MFRKQEYDRAGAYREAFYVAQDLDLWTRFSEAGRCLAIPDLLYQAELRAGSISAGRRAEQLRTSVIILECARARRSGRDEEPLLQAWVDEQMVLGTRCPRSPSARDDAGFNYFIGSMLHCNNPRLARKYYQKSLLASIFQIRSWVRLIQVLGKK